MADIIPVRYLATEEAQESFGEMRPGDTVPLANGGTGATNPATARANLGVSNVPGATSDADFTMMLPPTSAVSQGHVSRDNADPASTTFLYFHRLTEEGESLSAFFESVKAGDWVNLYDRADNSIHESYDATGPAVAVSADVYRIPVTFYETDNGPLIEDQLISAHWRLASEPVPWGFISGTLSNQTDLQAALNSKAPVTHSAGALDGAAGHVSVSDRANWDDANAARHSHNNKALLDSYSNSNANLTDAVSKRHTHANSAALAKVSDSGAGDQFLANDGIYKGVPASGHEIQQDGAPFPQRAGLSFVGATVEDDAAGDATKVTGLKGDPGDPGDPGATGPEGPEGPEGPPGADGSGVAIVGTADWPTIEADVGASEGDMYILSEPHVNAPTRPDASPAESGDGITLISAAWTNVGPIRGPQGEPGADGADGATGPQGDPGPQGDTGLQGDTGPQGDPGPQGDTGPIGPAGPSTPSVDANNRIVVGSDTYLYAPPATAAEVGLGNADNTSDPDKPISTATQTALDGKSDTPHTHTGAYAPIAHSNGALSGAIGHVSSTDRTNWDNAQANAHAHINLALLETYNQTNADLADAVSKRHDHSNKGLLDTYSQTDLDIENAVTHSKVVNGTNVHGLTSGSIGAEPAIGAKGSAFNKSFGILAGEVCEGNDTRLGQAASALQEVADDPNPVLGGHLTIGGPNLYDVVYTDVPGDIQGISGTHPTEDAIFFAKTDTTGTYNGLDGGILAKFGGISIHGSTFEIPSLAHTDAAGYQEMRVSTDGYVFAASPPTPGWNETDTSTSDVTAAVDGNWVQIPELNIVLPEDVAPDAVINTTVKLYVSNGNKAETLAFGVGINSAEPLATGQAAVLLKDFAGYITLGVSSGNHSGGVAGERLRIWIKTVSGESAVDALGSVQQHELLVSAPAEGGGGVEQVWTTPRVRVDGSGNSWPFRPDGKIYDYYPDPLYDLINFAALEPIGDTTLNDYTSIIDFHAPDSGSWTFTVAAGDLLNGFVPPVINAGDPPVSIRVRYLPGEITAQLSYVDSTDPDAYGGFPDRPVDLSGASAQTDIDGRAYTYNAADGVNLTAWSAPLPSGGDASASEYTCTIDFVAPGTLATGWSATIPAAWVAMGKETGISFAAGDEDKVISVVLRTQADGTVQWYGSKQA